MPELSQPDPAALHEQFVREMQEIDLAYAKGELQQWIERKSADERRAAGFDGDGAA